jgi:glycosyltransferase involved in cell wall biosynthesis
MFELIIVDNGSTDDTKAMCESFGGKVNLRYLHKSVPGLHVGRHAGMAHANGDILVYGDDDIEAFPTWLEAIAEAFKDENVALVGGKIVPRFECIPPDWFSDLWKETPWGRANGHHSLIDFGDEIKAISPRFVWGCNFSIRKDVLQHVGGFHPDGVPKTLIRFRGDGESAVGRVVEAKGLTAMYHPHASVFHHVSGSRMKPEYLYSRAYAQGVSDSYSTIRNLARTETRLEMTTALAKKSLVTLLNRVRGRSQAGEVQKVIYKGWQDGYVFHRGQVQCDNSLLDWVTLKDYLSESVSSVYYEQWQSKQADQAGVPRVEQ